MSLLKSKMDEMMHSPSAIDSTRMTISEFWNELFTFPMMHYRSGTEEAPKQYDELDNMKLSTGCGQECYYQIRATWEFMNSVLDSHDTIHHSLLSALHFSLEIAVYG